MFNFKVTDAQNPCQPNPCLNGGQCVVRTVITTNDYFSCICTNGSENDLCQTDREEEATTQRVHNHRTITWTFDPTDPDNF